MKIESRPGGKDIEAWQLAPVCRRTGRRGLTRKVYYLTKKPGFVKDYGLKRQIYENHKADNPGKGGRPFVN
jgi:hypothetical protein